MSSTFTEMFEHAKGLAAASSDEVAYRAAINRLYYSAFHACGEFHSKLPSPGSVGNAKGSHEQLVSMLDNPTIGKSPEYWLSKGLSKSLRVVLSHRVSADYLIDSNVTQEMLKESLMQCTTIISKCVPAVDNQTISSAGAS